MTLDGISNELLAHAVTYKDRGDKGEAWAHEVSQAFVQAADAIDRFIALLEDSL